MFSAHPKRHVTVYSYIDIIDLMLNQLSPKFGEGLVLTVKPGQ